MVESAADEHYGANDYMAIKDGGKLALAECPECYKRTFLLEADMCLACEATRSYQICMRCCADIPVDEQHFDGLCSYCDHMMSKDD